MAQNTPTLLNPSDTLVAEYAEKFKDDERYYPADLAITKLITSFQKNVDLEDILLKVTAINRLYSTGLYDINKVSRHILSLDIDTRIANNDLSLVESIARGHGIVSRKTGIEIYFYSFATKYCNWHNQKTYPIYDSFVDKLLCAYQVRDKFSSFVKDDLRNYIKFNKVIKDFINYYFILEFDLKRLDKFLWKYGQEAFPPR